MSNLYGAFADHKGRPMLKWHHYFPVYEKHFSSWVNKPVTFLEMGVLHGGSLQMWRKYFGPLATIIGIDINPACKNYEEIGVNIRIGDQSDPVFLQSIIDEFGIPDIIIDDGSHISTHQKASFEFWYHRMLKNGCYLIEDAHTSYWSDPFWKGGPDSIMEYSKNLVDRLNADHTNDPDEFTRNTWCMSFYDSMIVFERGLIPLKGPCYAGSAPTGEPYHGTM